MPLNKRTHPGALLKHDVFEPLKMSVTEAADRLGISRVTLSRVLNERAALSADLACRLELAGVGKARFWLDMQVAYDLHIAEKLKPRSVKKIALPVERSGKAA
ncbi:MAG: HigA family addiction module antitoxin [Acidobacteriaceae bacterium]|nr:HigA family addiction module antitoxin [Acidobacteriaceae bacterium]